MTFAVEVLVASRRGAFDERTARVVPSIEQVRQVEVRRGDEGDGTEGQRENAREVAISDDGLGHRFGHEGRGGDAEVEEREEANGARDAEQGHEGEPCEEAADEAAEGVRGEDAARVAGGFVCRSARDTPRDGDGGAQGNR